MLNIQALLLASCTHNICTKLYPHTYTYVYIDIYIYYYTHTHIMLYSHPSCVTLSDSLFHTCLQTQKHTQVKHTHTNTLTHHTHTHTHTPPPIHSLMSHTHTHTTTTNSLTHVTHTHLLKSATIHSRGSDNLSPVVSGNSWICWHSLTVIVVMSSVAVLTWRGHAPIGGVSRLKQVLLSSSV